MTYTPPEPNAALVVGPDDVLVLSFSGVPNEQEVERFKKAIAAVGLTGRVLCAWEAAVTVVSNVAVEPSTSSGDRPRPSPTDSG